MLKKNHIINKTHNKIVLNIITIMKKIICNIENIRHFKSNLNLCIYIHKLLFICYRFG